MADFRFFINRQGPRGPQGLKGEKGDPGNTFTVSEGVNTPTEYTLIFDGGDGNQFETDNLRNPIVDRGGTYVRYDRDNVVQYIGEPDMAVINGTPGIVNLAGKDTVTPNASDAVAYELLEKTVDELNTALENLDGRLDDAQGDITQAQGDIVNLDNRVTTNEGNISSLQSGKADKSTTYTKTEVNSALAGKANAVHTHTVSQITNAGALASQNTVDYQTQVTNKPIIPTVGNGTITLTQGGVTKGTFTTNQSGNSTIDLDAGGGSSFTEGNAINISNNTISVKYDGTTIGLNASGQLQSLVEEPDMTQYYTKTEVNSLIPGIATSNTKGIVQPDGTTIAVDANGVISANLPTPETVDQTYDATSTHAQSGVAIAGAGFMNGNIVQYPLQYLPDTTDSLTYQNVNTSTMIGSGKGIYIYYGGSMGAIVVGTESGTERFDGYTGDKVALISNSSLTWFEAELANGFNFGCKKAKSSSSTFTYMLGHYENNVFIPDAIFGNEYNLTPVFLYIVSTNKYYYPANATGYGSSDTYSYYLSGLTLTAALNGNSGSKGTVAITQAEADILNAITHIRIYNNNTNTSTLALSDVKVINPTSATPVTDGNPTVRQTRFDNGTNIFDAHPESLSLKYDSNTLGVNSSGQLYAQSSTPSNMVTTNTQQIITGRKSFNIIDAPQLNIGNTSGSYYWTVKGDTGYSDIIMSNNVPNSGNYQQIRLSGHNLIYSDNIYDKPYISSFVNSNKSSFSIGLQTGTNAGELNLWQYGARAGINNTFADKRIYKGSSSNSSTLTNFLLEKDMLDGTTIQYNSTSGKVEVVGGGGSSTIEIDEIEEPLIIKSVSAKKYSTPVTNNQLQCVYHSSPNNIVLSESTDYYLEYRLDNGLNCLVSFLQKGSSQSSYKCLGLQAGYYNDSTFVPVFSITDGMGYANMYYYDYIKGSGDNYSFCSTGYQKPNVRVSYDSTAGTLVIGDTTNTSTGYSGGSSINIDSGTQTEMAKVNVIRLYAWTEYQAYADGRYIDVSNYTCYNPSRNDYDFHSVVGGSGNTSTLMANFFADSTQQPISGTKNILSLKYDTNYLTVDEQGKLTLSAAVIAKLNQIT